MVQSIDRAVGIIRLLDSDDKKGDWAISEIAEKTSLPVSTVHRLLNTLMKHGLVSQTPETKLYKAGPLWMEIGLHQLEKIDYRTVAREAMKQLSSEVEESVYLNIPHGMDSIIIERVDSPSNVRIIDNLGDRIPLSIGAANKAILSKMDRKERQDIIRQLLSSSPEQMKLFMDQLVSIEQQGYALSFGERTPGTAAVASPILGFHNKVVGSISIGVLSQRMNDARMPLLIEKVMQTANEISAKIGSTM
ncbi:IclR family transcriptional regulator [Heyndrickxia acidicola]|uniref:IclR family transcriptional regulator n=1 Tax=Heyndrickxia acidicola TaxID=209389 RepID=A0ABU6MIC7_9BACI|nr:IclR family transcriptional regulator [Heyndrickxia acidicola]MED1204421.1 IclR family transcriptional regulator [Heyndrickxia acidicola]